jgi:hypothetical protein
MPCNYGDVRPKRASASRGNRAAQDRLIDIPATKWSSKLVNDRIAEERMIASGTPALVGPDSLMIVRQPLPC